MKDKNNILKFLLLFLCFLVLPSLYAQTTISGKVTDENGEVISFADIIIEDTNTGCRTDIDGNFTLTTDKNPSFNIIISYTGFTTQSIEITQNNQQVEVKIQEGTDLEEILVSASRKKEKLQDAPASVSIVNTKKIESTAVSNPIELLGATAGVTLEKQGGSRTNITMRGASGLFGTSTYVLQDYRSLIGVGLNTFDATTTSLNTIDVEKVEVIRGPGSALWGPGVTAGVVHFLTKNPFKYPGTTIELVGGNLGTFRGSIRHAGHTKDNKFGYKVVARFSRNNEWELDPSDSTDMQTMTNFSDPIVDPLTGDTVRYTGGKLASMGTTRGANLSLYYRPTEQLTINTTAGVVHSEGLFWNDQGEGYQASNDFFAQVRLNYDLQKAGNLFTQYYWNGNYAPNDLSRTAFLYRSGNLSVIDRAQSEFQLQYSYDIKPIKTDMIVGGDYRSANFQTYTRTFGRNEEDDDYKIYGGYIQTKTEIIEEKLDLVLAARVDGFSAIDGTAFAPRAAVVYKIKPTMAVRASYNRAFAPNSNIVVNIDFPLVVTPNFDFWLLGNKNPQTFDDLSTTWLIPGIPESPGVGMDILTSYGFLTAFAQQQIAAGDPTYTQLAPLMPYLDSPEAYAYVAGTGAFSDGATVDVDGKPLNIESVPVSSLREDNTLEIGFNGVIKKKLTLGVDLYQITRKNFTSLRQISPFVVLPTLGTDSYTAVTDYLRSLGYFSEEQIEGVGQIYQGTAEAVAAGPVGIVETDQVPEGGLPHVAYGYRNFGKVTYYGMDIAAGYQVNKEINVYGNYSWVNKNSFTGKELGEDESSTNRYDLNFAKHKVRVGGQYEPEFGFLAGLGMSYNSEFESTLGFYSGTVEARFLMDANAGYKFKNGIYLSVAVNNLTNNQYRTFPTLAKIGPRVLATIRYTFTNKKNI